MSRRALLTGGAALAVASSLPLGACSVEEKEAAAPLEPVFSAAQHEALGAAVERLLPGSTVLGVMVFIERTLRQHPFDGVLANGIRLGADELDAQAKQRFERRFSSLAADEQDEILGVFQRGELKKKNFTGKGFFDHLMRLTLEGYFGDPRHGGNRYGLAWELIGFEPCWWAPHGAEHGHAHE